MRWVAVMLFIGCAAPAAWAESPACPADTVLPQPARGCVEPPSASRWIRVARVALEVVMGAAVGAVPEVGGAYIGLTADVLAGHEAGFGTAAGAALGAVIGVAPGVWLAGYLMAGDGAFGWTVLGGAAGTVLASLVLLAKNTSTALVIAAALPVAGAVVAYELSSHRRRPAAVSWVPIVGPGGVGVVGIF